MKKPEGYEQAEVKAFGEFETLTPGGHVCIIKNVVAAPSKKGKEMLTIDFDISEGDNKGFYGRKYKDDLGGANEAKWRGKYYQLTEGNSVSFFKGMITSIENSNPGYKWDWNESTLVGKLFGGVFGQEEYENNKGEVKLNTKCMFIRTALGVEDAKVPDIKRLPGSNGNGGFVESNNDDDIPWG